jgi:sugar phosphate isomerase/epimerase
MFHLGIVSRSFNGYSVKETANVLSANECTCTELCFSHSDLSGWKYNGVGDYQGITPHVVSQKAKEFRQAGIEVTALGVFTNLLEPDQELRDRNLNFFTANIAYAKEAGIPYVSTECGFIPGRRGINADTYEDDYNRFKQSVIRVARDASEAGIALALEACILDVIPSAKRLRDLIDQIRQEEGLDNVKVLLDPANFLANSSEEDMFFYLKDNIAYFHGKDRKINAAYGCMIGDGDVNWIHFMKLYRQHTPEIPFILEYVNPQTFQEGLNRARHYFNTEI